MKKLYLIPLIFMMSLIFFIHKAHSYTLPDDIDLTEIYFNYQAGDSDDAVTLKSNSSTTITAPEWTPSTEKAVGYVASETVNIKITIQRNDLEIESVGIEAISAYYDQIGDFEDSAIAFVGINTLKTEVIERKQGSVASGVGCKSVVLIFYINKVNGQSISPVSFANPDMDYYAVLDSPQSPLAEP